MNGFMHMLMIAVPLIPSVILFGQVKDSNTQGEILASAALAVLGYLATLFVLPTFTPFLLRRGIGGKDLCKKGTHSAEIPIPEATGVIAGTVFLVCVVFLQLVYGRHSADKMVDYLSALLSICFMIFLGFTDDVLDLPWRYKLLLPTVATLPLLCAYDGSTSIVVPRPLDQLIISSGGEEGLTIVGRLVSSVFSLSIPPDPGLGHLLLVDLGMAYMVYMGMLAVFCTNAVNIYAGVNGLEAGQSFIVACAILLHNMYELSCGRQPENHTFSAMLLLPFIGTTLGLLRNNWYPAKVFVGDTFCYFAGMTFAVVGIHGHFSKTLILMFLPQGEVINLTLINLVLHLLGPMREKTLCTLLLVLQVAACAFGFVIRYYLAGLVYGDGA